MAHLLGAEGLHLEYPTKVVFDAVNLGIEEGDRIGIVGRNGDGKSSLLDMLAGRMAPDAGRVTVRAGTRIGVIQGLLGGLDWHAPVVGLSGGQRRRVALAALLADDWDVIALDEASAQTWSNLDYHEHTHEVQRNLADREALGVGCHRAGPRRRRVDRGGPRAFPSRVGAVSRLAW